MAKKYVSLSKLSTFLDNLKKEFAAIKHTHTISEISDYAVDSELLATSTNPVQNKVLNAEFDAISVAMNALESAVDESIGSISDTYETKDDSSAKLDEAKGYTDENIEALNEGFSNVIYQMYGNDLTDEGAPTIRAIAIDEANKALESAKNFAEVTIGSSKADSSTVIDLAKTVETNYDETIIGLSVDGTTVTYIKGDGSVHTFETQDTNTTYSLGTDVVTGLTKLYATMGNAEDGTMTQKAIQTELNKKVGVTVDDTNDVLIFTI